MKEMNVNLILTKTLFNRGIAIDIKISDYLLSNQATELLVTNKFFSFYVFLWEIEK